MQNSSGNPLQKYFRQPQIYLRLPSKGQFWNKQSLDLPPTGEIPVFSMTAKDELIIKTPDALMNGQSTVDLIQSCCPNIRNAWDTPTIDLDAILIAIRQATYGNEMEFTSVCPHCSYQNENALDLSVYSGEIKSPDYSQTVKINGLEFYFKPQTFQTYNSNNMKNYEEQRLLQAMANEDLDETEKLSQFSKMFRKLLTITLSQVADSVSAIKTEDGARITDRTHINEFFENCDTETWQAIKDHLQTLSDENNLRRIKIQCSNEPCQKDYESPLLFEMSNFFG